MRAIIPKEITEISKKVYPYLHLVEGQGLVLVSDAPPEIVEMRDLVLKWFAEHENK